MVMDVLHFTNSAKQWKKQISNNECRSVSLLDEKFLETRVVSCDQRLLQQDELAAISHVSSRMPLTCPTNFSNDSTRPFCFLTSRHYVMLLKFSVSLCVCCRN
uniref:EF-hand domain-containing protein n=1 Tax=Parascaris univalens TaxID=6257 RepID=A0A915B3E6_PARUN